MAPQEKVLRGGHVHLELQLHRPLIRKQEDAWEGSEITGGEQGCPCDAAPSRRLVQSQEGRDAHVEGEGMRAVCKQRAGDE